MPTPTFYNATVNVGRTEPSDEHLDALADYSAVAYGDRDGTFGIIVTLPASSLRQAAASALTILEAAGLTPQALEVVTTEAFDARSDGAITSADEEPAPRE